MWVPATEAELIAALDQGLVRESTNFDAKQALPPAGKNKDLAKDICAMTVDGGVLLYGLGGDDPTRPDKRSPFDLAGAAERIDLVAQTGIAEPPEIEIHDFPSDEQPGLGYLVVVVPPSPRAPHMLTLDRDNRFWARGETGNRILSESEVARLYERRERWEVDREALLDRAVGEMPFRFETAPEHIGPMLVLARPVAVTSSLLAKVAEKQTTRVEHLIGRLIPERAAAGDPYPGQATGLEQAFSVSPRGAGRWFVSAADNLAFEYQALLDIQANGELRYWHSPTINLGARSRDAPPLIMERSVTRAVVQTLVAAGWLYEQAGYFGAIDIGVAVLHIDEAIGATWTRGDTYFAPSGFGAPDYRQHERVLAQELQQPEQLTRRLLGPLFAAVSLADYDPFAESRRG